MTAHDRGLADAAQRALAINAHDRSLLVEAGAGSGKTALMAGRVAMMLASGTAPGSIAAVTFTELAASELLERVGEVTGRLIEGQVPEEMRIALPNGLSVSQRQLLVEAAEHLDEMACTTIHGFCQRLVKPYPVEADIDPGARVVDEAEADGIFQDLRDGWLRECLSGGGGLVAEMVLADPDAALAAIDRVAGCLREGRTVGTAPAEPLPGLVRAFGASVRKFGDFQRTSGVSEAETVAGVTAFEVMAARLPDAGAVDDSELIAILTAPAEANLCKADGDFAKYRGGKKKWADAAKMVGLPKAEAERLQACAERLHVECCETWARLKANAASELLARLVGAVGAVLERYQARKRAGALLDFDDLIAAAAKLLREHEIVRQALGRRYRHVLVDEFQDTDPLQTEILWRLCGELPAGATDVWAQRVLRPGALFLVGDPKQAIYRFRGADVSTYVRARNCILAQSPGDVLSISTNFRSCRSILAYVDQRFRNILSGVGQPGFTALDAYHPDHGRGPCIAALDVPAGADGAKQDAQALRDVEAEAVADLCARLIGQQLVTCKRDGTRTLRAGDIALLAPSGSDLWRYEEALESRGIPVSTQAGKGFFRRQEIHDLIALARVLADPRDTLALGALLRGPAIGLTDEELLDLVDGLPRDPEHPESIPKLRLQVDVAHISHPVARPVFERLQVLAKRALGTTPHDILSQAVDALMLRPVVRHRYDGHAERALANIDLFLEMSRPYSVRGLRAFAGVMKASWEGRTRAVEGRPDSQEAAVSLFTMHASKGLEWPVVIPINTSTRTKAVTGALIDRTSNCLYCPVFGVRPVGYGEALENEKREVGNERVRLWYVAATRARETLVLPRFVEPGGSTSWSSVVDLGLDDLPAIDIDRLPTAPPPASTEPANAQTREVFAAEADAVARRRRLSWVVPSRGEDAGTIACCPSDMVEEEVDVPPTAAAIPQGGRERGILIHKLLEEILTGETGEVDLEGRAGVLARQLGLRTKATPDFALDLGEVAASVLRALSVPEIAGMRERLQPELPVFGFESLADEDHATAGVADAIILDGLGRPDVVVDWKSDVDPSEAVIADYRCQVLRYLLATEARLGLLVFATSGRVVKVTLPP
ncbi:UvrD-helicase domain-containing protein [Methylorubrum extorquens]|uniref:DNA 3'-5' helicase n=1 Tax=Methylorubrum extorquens (strain CM4 / NCIMB 13688) TaxID=440085 RepID=B7L2W1_METC4|nr:UvrD-helicase domain-containing protein [Methylorubrum extorquens]ACK86169.1 UvrD/REP helicase [Methylorubrum extorquens CM4]